MQPQEKRLTKQQIQGILDKTPKSIETADVINGLLGRGFILEGLNDQPIKKEPNLAQKTADMAVGWASNFGNTASAYLGAGLDQGLGRLAGKQASLSGVGFKEAVNRISDQNGKDTNVAMNDLFGRDAITRDLSTSEGRQGFGGDILSGAATVFPAGKSIQGATLGAKAVQGAKIGATVGALSGAGTSMQEGNDLATVGKDALVGAGVGGAFGAAVPVAGAAINKGSELVKKGTRKVYNATADTVSSMRNAYTEGVDTISESTKSALNPLKTGSTDVVISVPKKNGYVLKKVSDMTNDEIASTQSHVANLYDKMLEKAKSFAKERRDNNSPLEIVGINTDKELAKVANIRKSVGAQMGKIEKEAAGVTVDLTNTRSTQEFVDFISSASKKTNYAGKSKFTPEVQQFRRDLNTLQKKGASIDEVLTFTRNWNRVIEDAKDGFGNFTKNKYENTLISRMVSEMKDQARNTLAEMNPDYKNLVNQYRITSQLRDEGNRLLGKEGMLGSAIKGASTAKRAIQSNSDGGARQFYNKLKELTGYDGLQEADIAIQAMKDAGDYQGLSLLEVSKDIAQGKTGIPNSIPEAIWRGINFVGEKVRPSADQRTRNYITKNQFLANNPITNKTASNINTPLAISNIDEAIIPQLTEKVKEVVSKDPSKAVQVIRDILSSVPDMSTLNRNELIKELTDLMNSLGEQ